MGISNVAINTFNSSGSQSICRASKYKEDTLIESDFLTKCNTKYISGSGQTVVQGSIKDFPTGLPSQITNHDLFAMPDDIDAISDIVLTGTMTFDIPANPSPDFTSFANSTAIYFSDTLLLSMINKVEIKLGGLIIDTVTSDAIFARNSTELEGSVCKYSGSKRMSESHNVYTNRRTAETEVTHTHGGSVSYNYTGTKAINNNKVEWSISIPFTGRGNMSNSFLQSGSTNNKLTMKVYYNQFNPKTFEGLNAVKQIDQPYAPETGTDPNVVTLLRTGDGHANWPLFGYQKCTKSESQVATNWKFYTSATVTTHMITETEKNFIRNNTINRILKTSETLEYLNPEKLTHISPNTVNGVPDKIDKPAGEFKEISFDISKFECNCSHLILSLRLPATRGDSLSTAAQDTPATGVAARAHNSAWPYQAGATYQSGYVADEGDMTDWRIDDAIIKFGSILADYGPLPKIPMINGWGSGVNYVDSYAPLLPEDNNGDFMSNASTPIHYPMIFNNAVRTPGISATNVHEKFTAGVGLNAPNLYDYISENGTTLSTPTLNQIGYIPDWLHSVELVVGGERTGFIPATALVNSQLGEFGLKGNCIDGVYIIKLADSAFSTSGVPFSKCNSIKLNIRLNTDIYNPEILGNSVYHTNTLNYPGERLSLGEPKLVATACGTTVQTTIGGSISFAA